MSEPTNSETVTTNNEEKLVTLLREIKELIIESKAVTESEEDLAAATISYLTKRLKDGDVLLEYKIIAHTSSGEVLNVAGFNNMPRVLDESMLPEAPSNFENAFEVGIKRPVLNAFLKHVRDLVEVIKKAQQPASPLLTFDAPQASDAGFLTDS